MVSIMKDTIKAMTKTQEEKWVEILKATAVIAGTLATAISSGKFTNKG